MIQRIKTLVGNILQEDYTSDKEQRGVANDIFNILTKILKTIKPNQFRYSNKSNKAILNLHNFNIENPNLNFAFYEYQRDNSKANYSFSYNLKYKTINIPVPSVIDLDTLSQFGEYSNEYFNELIESYQSTISRNYDKIIHEIIHYLDDMRVEGRDNRKYNKGDTSNVSDLEGKRQILKDYYSQPSEYNAFVQMDLNNLDNEIEITKKYGNLKELIDNNFNNFNSFLDFYKYKARLFPTKHKLTDDYFKKINNRLYQYYIDKKKELEDFLKTKSESWVGDVDSSWKADSTLVSVFRNPSKHELSKITNGFKNSLRFIISIDGSVYMWDGNSALHDEVSRQLKIPYLVKGAYFSPKYIEFFKVKNSNKIYDTLNSSYMIKLLDDDYTDNLIRR